MKGRVWDALIIGGGPAGLAAGLHLARAGYGTLLAERLRYGGQAAGIGSLENYPGYAGGTGEALMKGWLAQARRRGLKTVLDEAVRVSRNQNGLFSVRLKRTGPVKARALLWCGGAAFRALGVPGEKELSGKCVWNTADQAPSLRGRVAAALGGGEAAAQQAAALAGRAKKVYLVTRGPRVKAHRLLLRRLDAAGVERLPGFEAARIKPGALELRAARGAESRELRVDAVFVLVGKEPRRAPAGWRRAPAGFFTAGDANGEIFRQVAVAGGDGIRAAMRAINFLEGA